MPDAIAETPGRPERAGAATRATTRPSRTLTAEEIDRLRRFGERAALPPTARRCSRPASPGRACSSCCAGRWRSRQRDGFGRRQPLVEQGPGQFLAEAGQLSGRPALVDGARRGRRRDDPDPAGGPAGAAGRRGDARRADHPGADPAPGAADPGRARRAADRRRARTTPTCCGSPSFLAAQRRSRTRSPTRAADPAAARAARAATGRAGAALPLVITPTGDGAAQPDDRRARPGARADRPARRGASSSTWRWSAPGRPGCRRRSMPPPRG